MRTIILIWFPEQYTYSAERVVRDYSEPLEIYADYSLPTEDDIVNLGEEEQVLIFRDITIPEEAQVFQLQKGNCQLVLFNKELYDIIHIAKNNNDNRITLTAKYSAPYNPKEFNPFTLDDDKVEIEKDDILGEYSNG